MDTKVLVLVFVAFGLLLDIGICVFLDKAKQLRWMREECVEAKKRNRILETRIEDALFTLSSWDTRTISEWNAFELRHGKECKRRRKRMMLIKSVYGFKREPFGEVDEVSEAKATKKEIELILKGEFDEED